MHEGYRNQVLAMSSQLKEAGLSRWLNCQVLSCVDSSLATAIAALPCVKSVVCIYRGNSILKKSGKPEFLAVPGVPTNSFDFHFAGSENAYGQSEVQNQMLAADYLHGSGFYGQGILVAVMDGGFSGVAEMGSFSKAYSNGQMLGNWDFVEQDADVFEDSQHGTFVLSCMASWQPGIMVGTAPAASFVLFKTGRTRLYGYDG